MASESLDLSINRYNIDKGILRICDILIAFLKKMAFLFHLRKNKTQSLYKPQKPNNKIEVGRVPQREARVTKFRI